MSDFQFNTIEEAIKDISQGKMVIVLDDEDRENEGDFVMAAEKVTPAAVNFMATVGRGLICAPLSEERAASLDLDFMVKTNTAPMETAFTISIDATTGISTGISAADRSLTLKLLSDESKGAEHFVRPGHIFPLIGKKGGVLRRAGHTEAALDLSRLAGLNSASVICEILNDDGSMARRDNLFTLAVKHDLKIVTIKDLIEYRRRTEKLVTAEESIDFKNEFGNFRLHMYESAFHAAEQHVALVKGSIDPEKPTLVRVHSECFTGDIFGSKRCDCRDQLARSLELIEAEGQGVLLYMRQEGRGIGLKNKIKAYKLQDQGLDTVAANKKLGFKADLRDYGIGAQILVDLGVRKIRLLTNNPKKVIGLKAYDLEIVERVPLEIQANEINRHYLETKRDQLGHSILGKDWIGA